MVEVEAEVLEVLEVVVVAAAGDYVVHALVHVRLSFADVEDEDEEEEVEEVCAGEAVLQVEEEAWEREEGEAKVEVEVVEVAEVEVDEVAVDEV